MLYTILLTHNGHGADKRFLCMVKIVPRNIRVSRSIRCTGNTNLYRVFWLSYTRTYYIYIQISFYHCIRFFFFFRYKALSRTEYHTHEHTKTSARAYPKPTLATTGEGAKQTQRKLYNFTLLRIIYTYSFDVSAHCRQSRRTRRFTPSVNPVRLRFSARVFAVVWVFFISRRQKKKMYKPAEQKAIKTRVRPSKPK